MFKPAMIDSRDVIGRSQNNGTENFQALNQKYLGPKAVCIFISAIETGIIILLFARFLVRRKEKLPVRLLVYFVTFLAMFQMGATFASWWRITVVEFGNWAEISDLQWPDKIYFILSTFIAAPVQLFYISRCWHVSLHRRPYIAAFLVLLVLGSVAAELYVLYIECSVNWHSGNVHLVSRSAFFACSMLSVAFSVVVDFSVTGILLVFLTKSRSDIHTRQIRRTLFRLILITWEAALPPSTCAIAVLIAGAVGAPIISSWTIMLETVLGKLYLISLFLTLEGRATLAEASRVHFISGTSRNIEAWSVRPCEGDHSSATKQPDMPVPLEFKVMSSDPGADGCSTFDPESTKPQSV